MAKRNRKEIPEFLKAELDSCKTMEDLMGSQGLVKDLVKNMVTYMMEKELESKLGYEKNGREPKVSSNRRNGSSAKKVRSTFGEIELETPRDRDGEFEPQLVKKYQKDISLFDDKIISMYGKGMTVRDIQDHLEDMYGIELSPQAISYVTDKVLQHTKEWQTRPLNSVYAVVFFDAVHYKVRDNGRVISKAAYTCLGLNLDGKKDILGIWVGENEGAKYWLQVCNELKNRGVQDILISCIDGLKGLPDAIKSVFPEVEVQLCIVHMIRNSFKFIPHKHSKEFTNDLKRIYKSPSETQAQIELENLIQKWDTRYPLAVKPWVNHWDNLVTFLKFSDPIRKLIYTTNAVENLHRQFRKVTKNKAIFPTDDALLKMLFLAATNVSKKWTMPVHSWKSIISQLAIYFDGRLIFDD